MKEIFKKFINLMNSRVFVYSSGVLVVLLFAITFFSSFNWLSTLSGNQAISQKRNWQYELSEKALQFIQVESIVRKSVSENANIEISLPDNISKEDAKKTFQFTPKIKGVWLATELEKKLIFDPEKSLKIGNYYTATLETNDGVMGGDFLIEEDPRIINIFPRSDLEANEASDITILFNRPMVPLGTLDAMIDNDIPVSIEPATKGKFKWIGTRSLQFIPEASLIKSSNYIVKIRPEFKSLDGLGVDAFEHKFKTRVLRYEHTTNNDIDFVYNRPMQIIFNMEVDLEKTRKYISVHEIKNSERIDFTLEYGERSFYNQETKKKETSEDKSVLRIYKKSDRLGREKLWDFNTGYSAKITKAVPLEGDIYLDQTKTLDIAVGGLIKNISASSEKSSWVRLDLFDPEGKLIVNFYEDIDLDNSVIRNNRLISIDYGLKCKSTDKTLSYNNEECVKEVDKSKLVFVFDKNKIKRGDRLEINFEKVVNVHGLIINSKAVKKIIKIIPELKVVSSFSPYNYPGKELKELVLCTNLPLYEPSEKDLYDYISFNLPHVFEYWRSSTLITHAYVGSSCGYNEFQTSIQYGLMPNSDYAIDFKLKDEFGTRLDYRKKIQTPDMPSNFLNFYHSQKNVVVTTEKKTKLTFSLKNMKSVDLHICKLSAEDMMRNILNKPEYNKGISTVSNCINVKEDKIILEERYWMKNYFQIDIKNYFDNLKGHYLLTFSNKNYKQNNDLIYERVYLTVTDLGITEKKIDITNIENKVLNNEPKNIFWINSLSNLEAVSEAELKMYHYDYDDESIEYKGTVTTNEEGIAEDKSEGEISALLVTKDNDSAILINGENDLESSSMAESMAKYYIYTDRPIYRPTDKVNFKGIYRIGYDNDYEIFRDKKIEVWITDSRRDEVFRTELEVSEFGTFSFDFDLPSDAALGKYYIQTNNASYFFEVQEYVPSAFKVDLKEARDEFISGDKVEINIDASYFFGAPVENAEVNYSIASQDYHFDKYQGDDFVFGSEWYHCWWGCSYNEKFVLRNSTTLDENGKGRISHVIDLSEIFEKEENPQSKILIVYATVINSNGQSVSSQKSFIVHRADFYLGMKTSKRFLGPNEDFDILLKTVKVNGDDAGNKKLQLKIEKLEWKKTKRQEVDGAYYNNWEEVVTPVADTAVKTNNKGDFKETYRLRDNGQYRIVVGGTDGRGQKQKSTRHLYIYGSGQASVRPSNDHSLEIEASGRELKVGDTGEIVIMSPFKKAKALISLERGSVLDYEIVDINQSIYKYQFPIKKGYIPNIYASVTLLSDDPDVKYGSKQFKINTKEKELKIEVKTNKEHYLPGEEVTLLISTKDFDGHGVETDVSLAVADLSVLALRGNPKKNPLIFFYGGLPLTVTTASNFKNALFEVNVPKSTKGGGGGSNEAGNLASKKRGLFEDTAFWQAHVVTDKNGQAKLKFTLPDNLTTWQIEALGVSRDTKLGVDYSEFMAKKELMLTPLKPRFIVPGDEFAVGAKIFNQSDQSLDLDIIFFEGSLELIDDEKTNIVLPAKGSDIVYFRVKAPVGMEKGEHSFEIKVQGEFLEDSVVSKVKIKPNETYETSATAGYSNKGIVNEYLYLPSNVLADKGGVAINTSATLAVFLSDALNSLIDYPYGCSEQIASKLEAIAIIKQGLNLENIGDNFDLQEIKYKDKKYNIDDLVEIGLSDIYKTQTNSGGFKYYSDSNYSSFYLSIHIAKMLVALEDAGYEVDNNRLKRVFKYIQRSAFDHDYYYRSRIIHAISALSDLNDYGDLGNRMIQEVYSILSDNGYINEKIGSLDLVQLLNFLNTYPGKFDKKYETKVLAALENRIEIDSRGAFLPVEGERSWQNYETPVKNTAFLLKTLVGAERDNDLLDRILRWLLRSRHKDGAWSTTNNTLSAVDAMVDYMVWQNENNSNFDLDISLDQKNLASYTYAPVNILEQNSVLIKNSSLEFDKLHKISFSKNNLNEENNNFYYDLALKYYLPAEAIPPRDEGFVIDRKYFRAKDKKGVFPVTDAIVGEVLKAQIKITVPKERHFISIEDFIPAGVEIVNFDIDTENMGVLDGFDEQELLNNDDSYGYFRDYYYDSWKKNRKLYPDFKEPHDDKLFLFVENLSPGEYEYDYYVRVLVPGNFQWLPAQVQEMYFPENFGRTKGDMFVVNEKK